MQLPNFIRAIGFRNPPDVDSGLMDERIRTMEARIARLEAQLAAAGSVSLIGGE